jgi:hypothetical protein
LLNRVNDRAILLCVKENLEKSASLEEAKARINILLLLNSVLIDPETPKVLEKYAELAEKCSGAVTF